MSFDGGLQKALRLTNLGCRQNIYEPQQAIEISVFPRGRGQLVPERLGEMGRFCHSDVK
jgi:hypothetical protein